MLFRTWGGPSLPRASFARRPGRSAGLVELAPASSAGRIDLGTVLYNLGELDDAVGQLERAVTLEPGSARAHLYLSIALARLGRDSEAEQHRRRAADLGGAPDVLPARPPG